MNKIYRLLITITLLLLTSTIGYGQYSQGSYTYQGIKVNNELYSGADIVKDLSKQRKDTVLTRYFNLSFPVDSVSRWTQVVKYAGKSLENDQYLLRTKVYKIDNETGKLYKWIESSRTLYDKKGKKEKYVSRILLKDGLIQEYKNDKGKKSMVCIDNRGNKINDKGCLLYTYSKYPHHKMETVSDLIKQQLTNTVYSYSGRLPSYLLVNLEADYATKKWYVSFDFSKGYAVNQNIYLDLVTSVLSALGSVKVEDYHFNKDINGNYYNYMLNLPISFVNSK
ncbi:hypothetical protein [Myroides marinus]|uniref:hypothetical protein n=1 Tax=Myroides marinus TaxID=703342 RepID=UPI000B24B8DE|nr:hypothetical protein [Myroides marinus]